jgi:RES domain
MDLELKRPPGPLFRVGRDDDAWAVPDWAYAKEDRTFGNRFDDPAGVYRVLYASSQRLGCFIETLARFRVDVSFVADLALMENGEDDFTAFGTVRRAWIKRRCIGTANVEGEYADIYALGWVSHLRTALAGIAVKLGMKDFDLSSLEPAEPRVLTQQAGRIAFELGYAGVFYHSRYGHSIENWAIFEDWTLPDRFPIHQPKSQKVVEADPDLLEALRILGLMIGD